MNAADIASMLAERAAQVAEYLLPQGKKVGPEWKVGSIAGEPGQSLSVRVGGAKAGVWKDFASGDAGDLLDLWAAVRSQSISEALKDAAAYLGVREVRPPREEKAFKRPAKPQCQTPKSRVREWLRGRGLEDRTIDAFKVGEQLRNGKAYAVFPYLRGGELVNAKYRNADDKRDMRQEAGAEPCLFGWHLIDPKARLVAITEGEVDAMTLWQAGIPALSVNQGAGNHQWIESDWERLEQFSDILVAFDNDEAGNKGAKEVIRRLGVARCRRLVFPDAKDANEWLQLGVGGADFHGAVAAARSEDPEELRSAAEFMDRVKAMFYPESGARGDPVLRLDKDLGWFEFRAGELSVWTGFNGHGKSLLLSQVLLGLAQQGQRLCVFSGEMTPERQVKRMAKQASGVDRPTPDYLDAVADWLRGRAWIFDLVGSASIARLLEVFEYANKRYGIRQFVIDSLMMTDVPEDGPGSLTEQKRAMQRLCDFAKRSGSHVHLVAHPKKARDENTGPGKLDVAGSSKITDSADNVFTVWSARRAEGEPLTDEPDARLELQKQRNGDVQHFKLALWFVKGAQQYSTTARRRAIRYVEWTAVRPDDTAADTLGAGERTAHQLSPTTLKDNPHESRKGP